MSKVFMIRGQGSGVMTGRVYARWPTDAQLREALGEELRLHGFDRTGKPKKRWVMVVESDLDGASLPEAKRGTERLEGELDEDDVKKLFEAVPPAASVAGVGDVVASGTGKIINPSK